MAVRNGQTFQLVYYKIDIKTKAHFSIFIYMLQTVLFYFWPSLSWKPEDETDDKPLLPWERKGVYEPRCEKTGLWGFRPGPTQTKLYGHRGWLEA